MGERGHGRRGGVRGGDGAKEDEGGGRMRGVKVEEGFWDVGQVRNGGTEAEAGLSWERVIDVYGVGR